jgi:hypothetical protein
MQKASKFHITKGVISFLFLSLFSQLLCSSCQNRSISNPYKTSAAKPKPCKCATSNKPWLSLNDFNGININDNLLPHSSFIDYPVE